MLVHTAWLEAARFLAAGIDTSVHLAAENILLVGPEGQFMDDEMTLELLRSEEFFGSDLFDYEDIHESGTGMLAKVHRRAEEMVAGFESPLPEETREELGGFFRREYGRTGR